MDKWPPILLYALSFSSLWFGIKALIHGFSHDEPGNALGGLILFIAGLLLFYVAYSLWGL